MPPVDAFFLLTAAVVLPLLFVPLVLVAEERQRGATAWVALPAPLLSLLLLLKAGSLAQWGSRPLLAEHPWVPELGLALAWRLDGLALFFGLVVTGMGALVLAYSRHYLDPHAQHGRFYAMLLFFMSAMLGTLLADDLLLLFCSWELTGLASFLLIGFNAGRSKAAAYGARRALLVTLATGLGLLVAVLLLKLGLGTTRVSELLLRLPELQALPQAPWLLLLLLLAAFGKSAQWPFHFWLPGAMEAPTPVSAYLHSATMVKLGVFLAARLYPLFGAVPGWTEALCSVGGLSFLLGALGAFRRDDIKAVLAYTTLAQLGALLLWYGLAPAAGATRVEALGLLLILAHVLYKGSLFMVAGINAHVSGTRDLRRMGGLARALPMTALACALAVASQIGLPGTLGFLGKESLVETTLRFAAPGRFEGWALLALILAASALFTAVGLRLALQPYFGPVDSEAKRHWHHAAFGLQWPPLVLGLAGLGLGLAPALLGRSLGALAGGAPLELHRWHGLGAPFLLSTAAWAAGLGLYLWRWRLPRPEAAAPTADLGAIFDASLLALQRLAGRVSAFIRIDQPADYLSVIIAAVVAILAWTLLFQMPSLPEGPYADLNLLEGLVLSLMAGAAIGVVLAEKWTTRLISLSTAGFLVCFYFMLQRAPDLALTQMLIESATLVLLLLLLGRFPQAAQAADEADKEFTPRQGLAGALSIGVSIVVFFLILHVTASPHPRLMGRHFIEQTLPLAHGANAVNTVLVDFRGFDTMFEITVLVIAALGCLGLLMRPRARRSRKERA